MGMFNVGGERDLILGGREVLGSISTRCLLTTLLGSNAVSVFSQVLDMIPKSIPAMLIDFAAAVVTNAGHNL